MEQTISISADGVWDGSTHMSRATRALLKKKVIYNINKIPPLLLQEGLKVTERMCDINAAEHFN